MHTEHLIRMANQIAGFFASYPQDEACEGFRNHIERSWEPRMREQLRQYIDAGGEELVPLARDAFPPRPQRV
jgi:formate dehydrogenase subunit delta